MPELRAAPAWPLLLLLAFQLGAATGAPELWHCRPCSAEKLALCPPVPASCTEVTRPAGCGCCPMCALPRGAACGVATARCASGLSCRPLPGEQRPLQALTRGRGACQPVSDEDPTHSAEATDAKGSPALETVPQRSTVTTQLPIVWNAVSNYEHLRALGATNMQDWKKPCQRELYTVLERLGKEQKAGEGPYKFYLPNCNKDGFYHSKQCEASLDGELGLCWCVYPSSGRKIPESVEVRGDPNCQQYLH